MSQATSDKQTSQVIPSDLVDLLQTTTLADVATIGPNGEPQVNPVWFGWDGEVIKFSTVRGRQKERNLERDPRIALLIVDPTNPYRYIEVRGKVEQIEDDPDGSYIDEMAKKYMGVDEYPYKKEGDERVIVIIRPEYVSKR
jgi:PPOX class probable F420-dependent enzyme